MAQRKLTRLDSGSPSRHRGRGTIGSWYRSLARQARPPHGTPAVELSFTRATCSDGTAIFLLQSTASDPRKPERARPSVRSFFPDDPPVLIKSCSTFRCDLPLLAPPQEAFRTPSATTAPRRPLLPAIGLGEARGAPGRESGRGPRPESLSPAAAGYQIKSSISASLCLRRDTCVRPIKRA